MSAINHICEYNENVDLKISSNNNTSGDTCINVAIVIYPIPLWDCKFI